MTPIASRAPSKVREAVATALGVGGMMLLTAALMGLVFLSSGTGHDQSVIDPLEEDVDR